VTRVLIDAHTHLDKYGDDDMPAVLACLEQERILTVSVAVDPESFHAAERIAARSDLALATFGVHPWQAPEWADRLEEVDGLVERSPMVGEIGLDHRFVDNRSLYGLQHMVFCHLVKRAVEQDKIVNVHCSGAEADTFEALNAYGCERVIIHWYSGPLEELEAMIAAGYLLTVGVEVLSSDHIREVARRIPADQLLTETDNPGGHRWLTGELGMPPLLGDVVGELGRVKGMSPGSVESVVQENMVRLIGDDPALQEWIGQIQT
jgi:TatD DNase family protein